MVFNSKPCQSAFKGPYVVDCELLLWLQQQDTLVDASDGAQGLGLSLQGQRSFLCWECLVRGKLQGHLHRGPVESRSDDRLCWVSL